MQSFRKVLIATIRKNVVKVDHGDLFLFHLCGKGVSKVEIVGWIRSVDIKLKKITYYVDDGSDTCMRCTKFLSTVDQISHTKFKPGEVVSVKGVLAMSETNYEEFGFAIHISSIEAVTDPNIEAYHWLSCIDLYQSEYSVNSTAAAVTGVVKES